MEKKSYHTDAMNEQARLVPANGTGPFGVDEVTFFLYDHLGNTRVTYTPVYRPGTSLVQLAINTVTDFYPYGKVLRAFNSGEQERYLTTQHERDGETGLDYRGARYYDCDVARFLSLDPLIKRFPCWSAYNYVKGSPLLLVDPNGKAPTGDYYDWATNTWIGNDGVDDGMEYYIHPDAFYHVKNSAAPGEAMKAALSEYASPKPMDSPYLQRNANASTSALTRTKPENDASEFIEYAGNTLTAAELASNKFGTGVTTPVKSVGATLDALEAGNLIMEGADAVNEYVESGSTEKLKEVGQSATEMVGDGIADRLIVSPVPAAKAVGLAWYFSKIDFAGILQDVGRGPNLRHTTMTQEERQLMTDQDNTRTGGNAGNVAP